MVGLDLTLQAIATDDVVQRMTALGRLGVDLVVPPGWLAFTGL